MTKKSNNIKIKRVNMQIVKRILDVIAETNADKRTSISLKAHLSYDKCTRYLEWLESMRLVKFIISESGHTIIKLTEHGHRTYLENMEE